MNYPSDFVVAVKTAYPTSTRLHELLDTGNVLAGRILDDSCSSGIPLDRILRAISLTDLQEEARVMRKKIDLYNWWMQLYQEQRPWAQQDNAFNRE